MRSKHKSQKKITVIKGKIRNRQSSFVQPTATMARLPPTGQASTTPSVHPAGPTATTPNAQTAATPSAN